MSQFSGLPNGTGLWYVFPLNLFFGALLALIRPRVIRLRRQYRLPFLAVGCIGVVIANGFIGTARFSFFGPISALLCTAAVWSLAVLSLELPKILEPFRWMGKLSYGMYLLHPFWHFNSSKSSRKVTDAWKGYIRGYHSDNGIHRACGAGDAGICRKAISGGEALTQSEYETTLRAGGDSGEFDSNRNLSRGHPKNDPTMTLPAQNVALSELV